jgi:hypothetical protein
MPLGGFSALALGPIAIEDPTGLAGRNLVCLGMIPRPLCHRL